MNALDKAKFYLRSRRFWIILAVLIQSLVLAAIVFKRERIHAFGDTVFLRTAPVDPRDLFRGDYVDLEYDIALPFREQVQPSMNLSAYQRVFVELKRGADGVAHLRAVHTTPPDNALFIKGHTGHMLWTNWRRRGQIKFGIEKYFVEQGSGLEIERLRGRGNAWQTAMEVEVALGGDGTAVIRGHRWSPMGIKLDVLETASQDPSDDNATDRRNPKVSIKLRNQTDTLMGIPDSANHCSFQLFANNDTVSGTRGSMTRLSFANRNCEEPVDLKLHILEPNEFYSVMIDFDMPDWYLNQGEKAKPLRDIPNSNGGFRFVFIPIATPASLNPEAILVPNYPIRSAGFRISGRID